MTFEHEGEEYYNSIEVLLGWRENITIPVRFTVPKDELAGTYITAFNITVRENTVLLNAETIVNHTFDLSVLGYNDDSNELVSVLSTDISPGWTESFLVQVKNKGNAPETVELELIGSGSDNDEWSGYFSNVANSLTYTTNIQSHDFQSIIDMLYKPADIAYANIEEYPVDSIKIKLDVGQAVIVKFKIQAPTGLPEGDLKVITIRGISEQPELEDPVDNEVDLNLRILYPDLVVDDIGHPKDMEDGRIVTISAYIKNIGQIEARDVLIVLYIDDQEIKSVQMSTVNKGTDNLLITFNWQASSGTHNVRIEVDPENTVVEKKDQFRGVNNNIGTKKIDVSSGGLFDQGIARAVCSILLILITIIIISLMIVLWKKSGMFRYKD